MSDIVDRLRAEAALTEVPKIRTHQMMDEAANEIERLRADNEMLRAFRDMVRKEVGRAAALMEIPTP